MLRLVRVLPHRHRDRARPYRCATPLRLRCAAQEAVRFQLQLHGPNIVDGDVFVSNHPQLAGGSVRHTLA